MIALKYLILTTFYISAPMLLADPFQVQYSGNLSLENGRAYEGAEAEIAANFYDANDTLVGELAVQTIALDEGKFILPITLTAAQRDSVFDGVREVYIEVIVDDIVFPKQLFQAVPYALKVPVDGNTIKFNSSGELEVGKLPASGLEVASSSGSGSLVLKSSSTTQDVYTFPAAKPGTNGGFLKADSEGGMTWDVPSGAGDITGITAGTGLTGGGLSGDVTLNIDAASMPTLSGDKISGGQMGGLDQVAIGTPGFSTRLDIKSSGSNTDVVRIIAADDAYIIELTEGSTGKGRIDIIDPDTGGNIILSAGSVSSFKSPASNRTVVQVLAADGASIIKLTENSAGKGHLELVDPDSGNNVILRADSTSTFNGGNVGIGTTSPAAALHVDNSFPLILDGGSYTESDLYVLNSVNDDSGPGYAAKIIGVNIQSTVGAANEIKIRSNTDGATAAGAIYLGADDFTNQGVFGVMGHSGGAPGTDLNPLLTVKGDGKVGIGTTSPVEDLHVHDSDTSGSQIRATASNAAGRAGIRLKHDDASGGFIFQQDNTGAASVENYGNNPMQFYAKGTQGAYYFNTTDANTTRMFIKNDGNVGIGTATPTAKLDVNGDIKVSGSIMGGSNLVVLSTTDTATNGEYLNLEFSSEITDTAGYHVNSPSPTNKLVTNNSGSAKYWMVIIAVDWPTYTTGFRELYIYQDGTTDANILSAANDVVDSRTVFAKVQNGESINLIVRQTSGGSLALSASLQVYEFPGGY